MNKTYLTVFVAIFFSIFPNLNLNGQELSPNSTIHFRLETPKTVLNNVPFSLKVEALNEKNKLVESFSDTVKIAGIGHDHAKFVLSAGKLELTNAIVETSGKREIVLKFNKIESSSTLRVIPNFLSILPPLLAIALAFIARQVLVSLFCGVWLGAIFIFDYNIAHGFMETIDSFLVKSLIDPDHAAILIFSLTLGGMVGVMSKAGGTHGIVQKLTKYANHPRGGQVACWAMGLLIFFDDYANTLIVGNTMRPFTDRLKISREKLSYIVDSTAAPVASVALISTWIGFQVGLVDQVLSAIDFPINAYTVFLQSIPYATYSLLALFFVLMVALTLRDFGPMYKAEKRSYTTGKVLRDGAQPLTDSAAIEVSADEGIEPRWYNAIIPILLVITTTLVGLYFSGSAALGDSAKTATLGQIFGESNSFDVLLWASFVGLFSAILLATFQKLLKLGDAIEAAVNGYKSMMLAAMILILAWAIGDICASLHTADYIISITKNILSAHYIPFITFVVAAFISFSTGSSWATMAILTPIVVPIAHEVPIAANFDPALCTNILIATVGAILSGSVLGDHCSPISDTTILSSMASAADHVDHVRTQMPYALVVGGVASIIGYIPSGWGLSPYISLGFGMVILILVIRFIGKKATAEVA